MKRTPQFESRWRLGRWVVAASLCSVSGGCRCEDNAPRPVPAPELTSEDQEMLDVDRIRFTLHTPSDYAKEAFFAIDEDNVHAELERLRREIEADEVISSPPKPRPSASTPR